MSSRFRTLYLSLASSIAVALIVSAYVFSGPFSFRPSTVDAATAESLLKAYATKDSDVDGLPDWQESLYGTDPANPESVKAGVKDGDAVTQGLVKPKFESAAQPREQTGTIDSGVADDSITAQFARDFFSEYLTTYGAEAQLTEEQLTAFTEKAVRKLVSEHPYIPKFTSAKVTVRDTGSAALRDYAAATETVFAKNTIASSKNELDYMDDSIERNDPNGLVQVRKIGKAYAAIAAAYIQVPVPSEAAAAHLQVANSMMRLSEVITDMGMADTDPLRGLLGLMLYQEAAGNLSTAFSGLNAAFLKDSVVLVEGDAGYFIYNASRKAAEPIQP